MEAWIEGREFSHGVLSNSNATRTMEGELFVKMANTGRRSLAIEGIWLQAFEDELEGLRKTELVYTERVERLGFVARFAFRQGEFPAQLGENEPRFSDITLLGLDPLSRKRFCLVYVTGRRKPIQIQCWTTSPAGRKLTTFLAHLRGPKQGASLPERRV